MTDPTLPVRYQSASARTVRPGYDILASQYRPLVEGGQYLWARLLAEWGGIRFGPDGWQTTSSDFTTTPDNPGVREVDLAWIGHVGICQRVKEDGVTSDRGVEFGTEVLGSSCEVEITYDDITTGSSIAAETVSCGAQPAQWQATRALEDLDAVRNSGEPALIRATYRVRAPTAETAVVWAIRSGEMVITDKFKVPVTPIFGL